MKKKFSATPKSVEYNFCDLKTVDLVKLVQNLWGSTKFLIMHVSIKCALE